MTTEVELIYTIWDIVRAGQINADDSNNERLMRQFLSIHRGKILNEYCKKGEQIPDECFQEIGSIGFNNSNLAQVVSQINQPVTLISGQLPKIIRFEKGMYGMNFSKNGISIAVVSAEEWATSQVSRYDKYHPKLKFRNNRLTLYPGMINDCQQGLDSVTNTPHNVMVRAIASEIPRNNVNIFGEAILVNPDDGLGYDFTQTPYPMPDELIESMVNSVNAREFNLFLRLRSDEIGDGRQNTASYERPEQS